MVLWIVYIGSNQAFLWVLSQIIMYGDTMRMFRYKLCIKKKNKPKKNNRCNEGRTKLNEKEEDAHKHTSTHRPEQEMRATYDNRK